MSYPEKLEESTIIITVVEARNLPSADSNGFSDPYVIIKDTHGIHMKGKNGQKTSIKKKTLNPVWNEAYEFKFNYKLSKLVFRVYDHDTFSKDDLLGKVKVPIDALFDGVDHDVWWPLLKPKSHIGAGELRLRLRAVMAFPVVREGAWLVVQEPRMMLGLGWDVGKGATIDLDASVLQLERDFTLVSKASFAKRETDDKAIVHQGDNRTGEGAGDDECIKFDFSKIDRKVHYLAVTINSFTLVPLTKVKSAYVRVRSETGRTLLLARLSKMTEKPGVFFGFFKREDNGWFTFYTTAHPIDGRTCDESYPHVRVRLEQLYPRPEPVAAPAAVVSLQK